MSNHPRRHLNNRGRGRAESTLVLPTKLSHGYVDSPDGPQPFVVIHAIDGDGRDVEWVIGCEYAETLATALPLEIQSSIECEDFIAAKEAHG